ncbi:MAG: DUF4860 domain-containing protein [Firmicutes bacterium]|nr:DUF4860 domain-containing protein [Bacillota bacterium]
MRGRNALTEPVTVLVLMLMFGFAVYSLVYEGGEAEKRLSAEKSARMGARVAGSYVKVRLRQNDAADRISVEPNGLNGGDSIVIRNRFPEDPESGYDAWIYWADGELREVLAAPGETPAWEGANVIAKTGGFSAVMKDGAVSYDAGNAGVVGPPDTVSLRSAAEAGGR